MEPKNHFVVKELDACEKEYFGIEFPAFVYSHEKAMKRFDNRNLFQVTFPGK